MAFVLIFLSTIAIVLLLPVPFLVFSQMAGLETMELWIKAHYPIEAVFWGIGDAIVMAIVAQEWIKSEYPIEEKPVDAK